MMTFKDLKKLVELPSYKEQRVPTVKALEVSGVPVVTEKVLENHGSIEPMNFTNSPFERMMRQRPGTDSDHPCISCRHRRECGYMMHQCRKKFRSVFGDTAPPVSGTVGV